MAKSKSIILPFPGFYHSILSQELDYVEESEAQYFADERQTEEGVAEELHISQADYADMLWKAADYHKAHLAIAQRYTKEFEEFAQGELGQALGLVYEELTSPREYNFQTDRLFATIPDEGVAFLFALSVADEHETLAAKIEERHSSRDGFRSFYADDLESWLEKGVDAWDHNELATLLVACLELHASDEGTPEERVAMDMIQSSEAFHEAFQDCVDWSQVEEAVEEAREEARAALLEDDPEWEPAYRCQHTPDMFQGARF